MTNEWAGDIVSHARYTFFIVLYPVGITGELIASYKTWQHFKELGPHGDRPALTYLPLPNKFNMAFVYEDAILMVIPLAYIFGFPGLYGHMWTQRAKHYKNRAQILAKAIFIVPDRFKTFMPITGL